MSKNFKLQLSDIPAIVSSPKAFSVYACVGVVLTMVLTAVATKRYCDQEAEKSPEEKNEETVLDKAANVAKTYIVPAVSAIATVGCINKCNIGWQEYNGVINDALVNSQNTAAIYRSQAPGIVAATAVSGLTKQHADEGKEWFCIKDLPSYGDIYFQSTPFNIINAEYNLNRNFTIRRTSSVRELCSFYGKEALAQVDKNADYYGWLAEDFYDNGLEPWIDITHQREINPNTGEPITVIIFDSAPRFSDDAHLLAYGYELYPTE